MSVSPLKAAPIDASPEAALLIADLRTCLARADRLNLPMVAIHIEQACAWLDAHGMAGEQNPSPPTPIA